MGANWWDAGLNFEVWSKGKACGTCSGKVKYSYTRTDKPTLKLFIYPTKQRFELMDSNTQIMQGGIDVMITLLNTI